MLFYGGDGGRLRQQGTVMTSRHPRQSRCFDCFLLSKKNKYNFPFGETKTRKANKGNISLSFAVSQILSSVLFGGNTRWGRQNLEGSPHYFLPKTQAAHRERGREHWDKKKTGRGQSEGLSFGCLELPVYCWVQWFVVVAVAVSVRKRETLFLVLCVRVNLNKTLK